MAAVKKKLVKEIITKGVKLVTCSPKDKVADAMKLMVKNKVSGLPVIDDAGKIAGVITEADVLGARKTTSVRAAMTAEPVTIAGDATIKQAVELLLSKKIKRALVPKEDGSLWGVVSRTDLVKALM